ncbi:unnamed protein product [Bursaphelenchus xylophilus]|uniref:(pine wood nematode) hypothetical protein n=1 Tax=Bursaphelenchus xylophilus TaxID=6326 RepID=A0A1I7S6Y5_BURXY|nr:unnamed protein product [Bursaphelenchus xylophilus]CAG9079579.1 unnamed protein product [Bursaphelenchus xylophilus]
MDGCHPALFLLMIVNVDVLQGQEERGCAQHYSVNGNNRTKPVCKKDEICVELGVKNFTVYVEDHSDYYDPFDYMSVVSRYKGGLYTYENLQLKTGKR